MNISIRQVEGGYHIKLSGRGKGTEEWVTNDEEEVVRIVRREFLGELTPDEIASLEEGVQEEEEKEFEFRLKK